MENIGGEEKEEIKLRIEQNNIHKETGNHVHAHIKTKLNNEEKKKNREREKISTSGFVFAVTGR